MKQDKTTKGQSQAENMEDLNGLMKRLVPETDSSCAFAPMKNGRWYKPKERLDDDSPCFIASAKPNGPYQDYIWMPKRGEELPAGYYHLKTKESYIEVCSRLDEVSPGWCCGLPRKDSMVKRKERGTFKDLKVLMNLRRQGDSPNDDYLLRIHRLKHGAGMHRLVSGLQHLQ